METTIKRWYKKVWQTRGARFNSYERLEKHAKLSTLTMVILTVYIIAINLFPQVSFLKARFKSDDTNYLTIVLSVLILSISQYIGSKEYRLRAFKIHNCAKELTKIYEELALYNDNPSLATIEDIKKISVQYQAIIDRCEENHANIDLQLFIRDNIREFKNIKYPNIFKLKVTLSSFFNGSFIYWFFILSPPLIFLKAIL